MSPQPTAAITRRRRPGDVRHQRLGVSGSSSVGEIRLHASLPRLPRMARRGAHGPLGHLGHGVGEWGRPAGACRLGWEEGDHGREMIGITIGRFLVRTDPRSIRHRRPGGVHEERTALLETRRMAVALEAWPSNLLRDSLFGPNGTPSGYRRYPDAIMEGSVPWQCPS